MPSPLIRRLLALVLALTVTLSPATARASLWGEENAPLYTIVTQMGEEIAQGLETFSQIKATYDETKKYVDMVEDAARTFNDVKAWGQSIVTRPDLALGQLFPEADALRRQLRAPDSWAQGTGGSQQRVRVCLDTADSCGEFSEGVRPAKAAQAISTTFGAVPSDLRRDDLTTLDVEAAVGLAASTVHEGKASLRREQYQALMKRCLHGTDDSAMAACQAAANLALILQAQQTADLNEQTAVGVRLQAVGLVERNAQKKQALTEAAQRRQAVADGFRDLAGVKLLPAATVHLGEQR